MMKKIAIHVVTTGWIMWFIMLGWACSQDGVSKICLGDNDCEANEKCIDSKCVPETEACVDQDKDGYGEHCDKGSDCNDNDATIFFGAPELCDGKDNDCNGIQDSGVMCESVCCGFSEICFLQECMVDLGGCEKDEDCQEDSYCHEGQCIPYGKGPRDDTNPDCTRLSIAGLFQPALQCEWTFPPSGDSYPAHIQVLGTPMVADFDFDDDSQSNQPSIVFLTYDSIEGDLGVGTALDGVIRIIDGKTCQTQFSLGPYLNASNPVAIGDLDQDGRPEIVAHRNTAGAIAYRYNPEKIAWEVLWEGHRATGEPVVFEEGATSWGGPSLIDLNDDGRPEVLSGGLVYDAAGLLLDEHLGLDALFNVGFPVAADLDGDGKIELAGGLYTWEFDPETLRWEVQTAYSGYSGYTAAADFGTYLPDPTLDNRAITDGTAEIAVVSYGQIRIDELSGRTIFGPIDLPSSEGGGPPTIGDFDGDGRAEVAASGSDSMTIFDPDCIPGADPSVCPTARVDGILWTQPSQDHSSNITGSSLFDFEGDKVVEAIYADECFVRVYRGTDGKVLYSQWRSSCTWIENPIVADVDGDFSSELVVPSNQSCAIKPENMGSLAYETSPNGKPMDPLFVGLPCKENSDCVSLTCVEDLCRCETHAQCGGGGFVCAEPPAGTAGSGKTCRAEWQGRINGVRVYRDTLDRWVGSRSIWNQHAYSITNVTEAGIVPKTSEADQNWLVAGLNNFRQNIQGDLSPHHSPDMTAGGGSFNGASCDENGTLTLQVRACNRGTNPVAAGIQLGFYAGDPDLAETKKICQAETTQTLAAGACEIIECTWPDAPEDDPTDITVVADDGNQRTECIETNNRAVIHDVTCSGVVR